MHAWLIIRRTRTLKKRRRRRHGVRLNIPGSSSSFNGASFTLSKALSLNSIEEIVSFYHNYLHGMVWYGMVWYGMVWYGMVWYGMVQFS